MTVTITGLEEVSRKLASLNKPQAFQRPMKQAVMHVLGKAHKYPPKPAHSTYVRTGDLGGAWGTKISNQGRTGLIENTLEDYERYVQGDRQRGFHAATGWKTDKMIAESEAATVAGFFAAEYNRLLK